MTESVKQINVNCIDRTHFFDGKTYLDQLKSFTRKKYMDNQNFRYPARTPEAVSMPCRIMFFILHWMACMDNTPVLQGAGLKKQYRRRAIVAGHDV